MRSKKFIVGYAVAAFLLVFLITFNSVCSIKQFDVRYATGSAGAAQSAEKIQERLSVYLNKSYLFFKTENVYGVVDDVCAKDGTYLKVTSVEKNFPNRITVHVEEEYEQYAFYSEEEDKYYVTDADGKILAVKDSAASNLVAEADNLVVRGFSYEEAAAGETIASGGEAFAVMQSLLRIADERLGGVRGRIAEAVYLAPAEKRMEFICFRMTEGLEIWLLDVGDPAAHAEDCFAAALEKYALLTDAEKTYGYLQPVFVAESGSVGQVQHYAGVYDPLSQ